MIGVVEDDPIMGESLVQRLELEGYRVSWWHSGEEAVTHLGEARCQVLVCDIRLPDMDGEQLFRRALTDLGATPVIFITAFGEVEQAVRLMRAGADDYMTKPFEVEALLHKIAALCAREITAGNDVRGRMRCRDRTPARERRGDTRASSGRDRCRQGSRSAPAP